jgi:hypothetical protein
VFFADVTIVIRYHPVGAVTVVGGWARSDSGTTVQISVPWQLPTGRGDPPQRPRPDRPDNESAGPEFGSKVGSGVPSGPPTPGAGRYPGLPLAVTTRGVIARRLFRDSAEAARIATSAGKTS